MPTKRTWRERQNEPSRFFKARFASISFFALAVKPMFPWTKCGFLEPPLPGAAHSLRRKRKRRLQIYLLR
jgi:hypothetical protein